MLLKIKLFMIVMMLCSIFVIGAPNLKGNADTQNKEKADAAKTLVKCRTTQEYLDLSDFKFNPRNVSKEDSACLSLRIFREMGLINHFNISVETLARFILRAQEGYQQVPYHNWFHGFAVFHFSFAVLKKCQLIGKQFLTPLEGLALLTAAICHDIDHRGTNNQFQIETNNSLAQKYAKQGSIMERHHIEVTLGLLNKTETDFVSHLEEENQTLFKDLIREIILATDLTKHFKLLPEEQKMAAAGFNALSTQHRELLLSSIISCADLSDQTKDWTAVRVVVTQLYTEFFAQGDRERQLGLTPVKMMDPTQANIPQEQVDFLTHVVIPDFQVLLSLYPEMQSCMDNIKQNLGFWKKAKLYYEEQLRGGRNKLEVISDSKLDQIFTWPYEE